MPSSDQAQATSREKSEPLLLRDGYQVVKGLLPASMCQFVSHYYSILVANQMIQPRDQFVELGHAAYGLPLSETLLAMLTPSIAKHAGAALFPTYSYSRVYRHGAELIRHRDRWACEVSCSLTIDYKSAQPWPFSLEDKQGQRRDMILGRGDALLYTGPELPHWRDRFAGEWQVQIFLHYVRQDGPHAHLKFDRRAQLGAPEVPGTSRVAQDQTPEGR